MWTYIINFHNDERKNFVVLLKATILFQKLDEESVRTLWFCRLLTEERMVIKKKEKLKTGGNRLSC